jgi:hypothetical protein
MAFDLSASRRDRVSAEAALILKLALPLVLMLAVLFCFLPLGSYPGL